MIAGVSPSGKALVSGTSIPRFESWSPSHFLTFDKPAYGNRVAMATQPTRFPPPALRLLLLPSRRTTSMPERIVDGQAWHFKIPPIASPSLCSLVIRPETETNVLYRPSTALKGGRACLN